MESRIKTAMAQQLTGSLSHFTLDYDVELSYDMNKFLDGSVTIGGTEDALDYSVGDTLTLVGGTFTTATVLTIDTVAIGAVAIAVAGTTYTNGTFPVTLSTGGTGTAAVLSVTVAGGIVTDITVTSGGSYTAVPTDADIITDIEAEIGAGDGLFDCNADWNAGSFTVTDAGDYTVLPANPVATTSATGTGATVTAEWTANNGVLNITVQSIGLRGTIVEMGEIKAGGVVRVALENASNWVAGDLQTEINANLLAAGETATVAVTPFAY
jgi:hypothetical protein